MDFASKGELPDLGPPPELVKPVKPDPPAVPRTIVQLEPHQDDFDPRMKERVFTRPPVLSVSENGSAIPFDITLWKGSEAGEPLATHYHDGSSGTVLDIQQIFVRYRIEQVGVFRATVQTSWVSEQIDFTLREVLNPAEALHREDPAYIKGLPYFNDEGLLRSRGTGTAVFIRDRGKSLYRRDEFSRVVFPVKLHAENRLVIRGWFLMDEDAVGREYESAFGVVLANPSHGQLVRLLLADGPSTRHVLSTAGESRVTDIYANEAAVPDFSVDRSYSKFNHFVVELIRLSDDQTLVRCFFGHGGPKMADQPHAAFLLPESWMFEAGVSEVELQFWRLGRWKVGPIFID